MRLARRGTSNADDVGLVGAAPQKGGPDDAPDAGHVLYAWEDAGFLMLMLLV